MIKNTIFYGVYENFLDYLITVPDPLLIRVPVPAKPNYCSGSGSGKKFRFLQFRFRNTVYRYILHVHNSFPSQTKDKNDENAFEKEVLLSVGVVAESAWNNFHFRPGPNLA